MARLIDADAMRDNLLWCKSQSSSYDNHWDDVIERLDAQPTVGGWISVKDRLPEEQIPVLVYVPPYSNENEKYAEYVGVAYYMYSAIGGYWAGTDGNVYGAIGIIHDPIYWMPMPEPPKEENSGNEQHMP